LTLERGNEKNKSPLLSSYVDNHFLVPTRWRGNALAMRQRRFTQMDAGASRIGSHAGAWEPEKSGSVGLQFSKALDSKILEEVN
jgi:hypothetical protein